MSDAFDKHLAGLEARVRQIAIDKFTEIGEEYAQRAYNDGSYKDKSGDLRGSIGYAVAEKGRVLKTGGFYTKGGGINGSTKGRAYAIQVASKTNADISLTLVVGESYATYVSGKGYNVDESARLWVKKMTPLLFAKQGIKLGV